MLPLIDGFLFLTDQKTGGSMKFNSGLKRITILLVVLLGLSVIGLEVSADNIKRSCNAYYYGWVTRIETNHGTLNVPFQAINFGLSGFEFSAQGGCGKLVPNRCRRRARDKLLACAKAQVNSPNQTPGECSENALTKYPLHNLTSAIEQKACGELISTDGIRISSLLSKPYQVHVMIGVSVRGKDDCGYDKPGTTVVEGHKYRIEGNKLFLSEPLKSFTVTCQ
jgi:hypothetical protein